ncbi:CYTH domain-containing protein [Alcanivorax sp. JB21]|uniref:CYTH domain-containing protein n=1 Tax=Alcanivorax limicola TaxID=2874102 RepID=UPI001CBED250|nr:CYTH domain-containing protein [Alcanivorax limicola]MBZ2189956.1 CYTH domain-containing protein [Alcanivorax limicola]
MGVEIERKFLVRTTAMLENQPGLALHQGYLSHTPETTVRVRIQGEQAWLTVKGRNDGARRAEFEYAVPVADARDMLALCPAGRIEKTRYRLPAGEHVWEVDVFHGDNEGLIVAEIELRHEDDAFERPPWLGQEVTGDPRYYNSQLSQTPYRDWAAGP